MFDTSHLHETLNDLVIDLVFFVFTDIEGCQKINRWNYRLVSDDQVFAEAGN